MSGESLIWVILLFSLSILNYMVLWLNTRKKTPLWLCGIIIGILGPLIAFISGSIFIKMTNSDGGSSQGAAYEATFIGLVIVANGILYLIIGVTLKIKDFIAK